MMMPENESENSQPETSAPDGAHASQIEEKPRRNRRKPNRNETSSPTSGFESSGSANGNDDEVRIEGVSLNESEIVKDENADSDKDFRDDKQGQDRASEGTGRSSAQGRQQDSGGGHTQESPKQNSSNRNRHHQNQSGNNRKDSNKKTPHPQKFQRGKNNQRNQKPAKSSKQPRKFQRNKITLADGGQVDAVGLELGDLPQWEDLQDIDELHAIAREYQPAEEALDINDLYQTTLPDLRKRAEAASIEFSQAPSRHQLLRALCENSLSHQRLMLVKGVLELLEEGHGLITYPEDNYRIYEHAVFVSSAWIRHYGLQRGHQLTVLAHPSRSSETAPYALSLLDVNGRKPRRMLPPCVSSIC